MTIAIRSTIAAVCLWAACSAATAQSPTVGTTASANMPEASSERWRFTRSTVARPGKFPEAAQYARDIAAYLNSTYPNVRIRAYAESFGNTGTIHWSSDWKDLAAIEDFTNRLQGDKKYWSMIRKNSAELFLEGTTRDTLLSGL